MNAGWKTKTLGEICDIKGGKRVPKGYKLRNSPTAHPYISVTDFTDDGTVSQEKLRFIDPEIFEQIKNYTISSDDLYVSIAGTIGKTGYVPCNLSGANLTENACKLVLGPEINRDFLYHVTRSNTFSEYVEKNTRTAAQPKLSLERLKTIPIPIPPIEEQQRIVAILDEAFEGLTRARTHAEANLQNARELFDSALEAELAAIGDKNHTKLGDNIDLLAGHAFKSAGYSDDPNAIRLMRGDNIIPGAVRWEQAKYWPLRDYTTYEKFQLQANDVLIAMDRTWIKAGIKYAVLTDDDIPSLLVQRVARLRCKKKLNTQFLAMLIGSKLFERYVLSIQTGAGVPHISPAQIKNFSIPLPDISRQDQIVERLLNIDDACAKLSKTYSTKIEDLDDARKSLLQKAFTGELA